MNKRSPSLIYDIFESPVGTLYLIFSGHFLAEVSFKKPVGISFRRGAASKDFIEGLNDYFKGTACNLSAKIKFLEGTDFEKKVWLSIKDIPYGETRPYKWVAERIGNPSATRAVGQALSKNPVPIVLPCHRVIESDGSIGGYSSGVNIKRRLLEMEYYAKINR
ncbi:MAG: methylated-DNA--[protein]-cysteine S-methyltransferase [Nitrospirae bacterium]|nr:methylated-DNA--[protein]-cysteine S-methyltransferase [Nitrospirota bacterium]